MTLIQWYEQDLKEGWYQLHDLNFYITWKRRFGRKGE